MKGMSINNAKTYFNTLITGSNKLDRSNHSNIFVLEVELENKLITICLKYYKESDSKLKGAFFEQIP